MHRRDFLATSSGASALALAAASGFTPAPAQALTAREVTHHASRAKSATQCS